MQNLGRTLLIEFCLATLVYAKASGQAAPAAASGPQTAGNAFQEELIAEIPAESELKNWMVGKTQIGWVEKRDGKESVRLNGKQQGKVYDEVKYLTFSPDDAHFAFFGKRDSSWIFVLDGQEHSQRYKKITSPSFQPKGNSYSYCGCVEKKCQLVVDGAETGADYEDVSFTKYSRDGKRLAFFGKRQKKWIAVVEGKELDPPLDEFWGSAWGFSRNGEKFYAAGFIKGTNWTYVVDGKAGPGFGVISRLSFSADGGHYAYSGTVAKGGFKKQKTFGSVVLDGQASGSYEGRGLSGSWTVLAGTSESMIEGVRDLNPDFHGISNPEFNPEGKLMYAARREKGDVAVFIGNEAGPGFEEILSPVIFDADSGHFAYVARQGEQFIPVRDNHPGAGFTPSKHGATNVGWIALSGGGQHLAFETISGGSQFKTGGTLRALRTVVLDGVAGKEYDALSLVNFDLGKTGHYCYEVRGASGDKDLVNVDGHESRLYNAAIAARFSDDAKNVTFVARDGGRFFRVTYSLGSGAEVAPTAPVAP
jgi:hypothetical protein